MKIELVNENLCEEITHHVAQATKEIKNHKRKGYISNQYLTGKKEWRTWGREKWKVICLTFVYNRLKRWILRCIYQKINLNKMKKVHSIFNHLGVNLQNTKTMNKIDQWETIKHLLAEKKTNGLNLQTTRRKWLATQNLY